jgi:hypothetical protein
MNERNLNEGQWKDRKQWSLGVGQRRKTFWNLYIHILVTTFMQDIYHYILETNHVSMVYSVASILYLQFVLHGMLLRPWNMFCTIIIIIIITTTTTTTTTTATTSTTVVRNKVLIFLSLSWHYYNFCSGIVWTLWILRISCTVFKHPSRTAQ